MQERRSLNRSKINKCAVLKLSDPAWQNNTAWFGRGKTAKDLFCQITDINCSGAQILLNERLPNDVSLKAKLQVSEDNTIEAEIWVAWHRMINGSNHYGLYFSEIQDADKEKINVLIKDIYSQNYPEKPSLTDGEIYEMEGGEEMNDYRIFERFKKELAARFIGLDGKEGTAKTIDISAKGLGLTSDQKLESQTPLEIWLDVPGSTEPLYTRGQVVWSQTGGSRGWHSGIELERADLMGISRLLRT